VSTILKSESAPSGPTFTGVANFNLDDLATRAAGEVQNAQTAAAQILQEARDGADAIRAAAVEEGREAGLKDADQIIDTRVKVAVDAAVQSRIGTLEAMVDQLWQNENEWLQHWRDQTLELALELTRKITRSAIEQNPDILIRWAEEALESVRGARSITIAVHPETLSILGQQLDIVIRRPGLPQQAHVEPDESVEPMGVVIRQEGGEIDLQLQTQLQELSRQLNLEEA